ncbi:MAG: helix-turn-helix domain-containing protein [Campylobacteraceae bacterium]|jgi:hypothetical protein|nr:helix-turn-helix domain-containing protein [Campylobacteraceae bacterium]
MEKFKDKKWLTPKEASEYTGFSISFLCRLRSQGRGAEYSRIKAANGNGRKAKIVYRVSDLDRFLEQSKIKTA